MRRALAIVSICLAAAVTACGDDDNDDQAQDTAPTTQAAPTTQPPEAEADGGCEQATEPPSKEREAKRPRAKLDPDTTYRLVFATNCGEFTITLDQDQAPLTSASLVALAKASSTTTRPSTGSFPTS